MDWQTGVDLTDKLRSRSWPELGQRTSMKVRKYDVTVTAELGGQNLMMSQLGNQN